MEETKTRKKLGTKTAEYEIAGKDYTVRKPSALESEDFNEGLEALKGKKPKERAHHMIKFISKLGIPEDVVRTLCYEDLNEIAGDLGPKK
jgi:hypothetical protein